MDKSKLPEMIKKSQDLINPTKPRPKKDAIEQVRDNLKKRKKKPLVTK